MNSKSSQEDLEALTQCGICLDDLTDPRILPCQHTFCLSCLQTHLIAVRNSSKPTLEQLRTTIQTENTAIKCPLCQTEHKLDKGFSSLEKLPKNQYVEHLFQLVDKRKCEKTIDVQEDARNRLEFKYANFKNSLDQIEDTVKETAVQKIAKIKNLEKNVLQNLKQIETERKIQKQKLLKKIECNDMDQLLVEIDTFCDARLFFDPVTFTLDQDTEAIYNEVDSTLIPITEGDVIKFYRNKQFTTPKLSWNKCPRPASVATSPWNANHLYITCADNKCVLILDKTTNRIVQRLKAKQMLCPHGITFCTSKIYLSDRWQHCIHVFERNGQYLGEFLKNGNLRMPGGLAMSSDNLLVIADTGNNQVLVVDVNDNFKQVKTIGMINKRRTLSMPNDICIDADQRIIVADSGNHKIKVFSLSGAKLGEFGTLGRGLGQFRSVETVAVDKSGLILVGDAGNGRIQVFRQDGRLVKVLGRKEGYGWVSGVCVTSDMEIVVTDIKANSLMIF